MKITVGLILILGAWISGRGQVSDEIMVREQRLSVSKDDSLRGQLMYELEWLYADTPINAAITHLEKSLQVAKQKAVISQILLLTYRLGYCYLYFVKDETKAMYWLNECIRLAIKANDNLSLANSYLLLSIISDHQKSADVVSLLNKAISYASKTDDWRINSEVYLVKSTYHHNNKDFKNATLYVLRAMSFSEKKEAKKWLSQSLDYCDIVEDQGKTTELMIQLQKMQQVAKTIKKNKKDYVLMNDLARLQTKLNNYENAEQLYLEVLATERAKNWPDTFHLFNVYRYLLSNYISQGDYKKAYNTRTQLTEIELFLSKKRQTESAKIQMAKIQAAQEIANKEAEVALVKAKQKQQNIYFISAIIVLLLVTCLTLSIWRSRQKTERQKVELTQLNHTKDKLFAILSHDLRSPVATLKNYMMLVDWGALNQEEFINITKHLKSSLNNTHNMLENVLNWSITQLGGLKTTIEKVNITEVINEQIQWQQSTAKEKSIEVINHISPAHSLQIDKNHLAIIVRNLLQNALKFTPTGGEIIFDFYQKSGINTLIIKDNGSGISQEKYQTLFQINKEAQNTNRSHGQGTGLGLVLVKDLVERNAGKIEIDSSTEQGTIFKVTFG